MLELGEKASCCGVVDVCRADHRLLRMLCPHIMSPPARRPATPACRRRSSSRRRSLLLTSLGCQCWSCSFGAPRTAAMSSRWAAACVPSSLVCWSLQMGWQACNCQVGLLFSTASRLVASWEPQAVQKARSTQLVISCPRVLQAVALFAPDQPSDDDEQPEGLAAEEVAKGIAEMIVTGGGRLAAAALCASVVPLAAAASPGAPPAAALPARGDYAHAS